ncbi:MAG TPA: dihydrolipoyl dehydrogenase [Gammaproteobacteria bacterium]
MQQRSVDAVVIGAGSAGLNAVAELDRAGADWVLVEAGPYGTTCARVGCMPSKLLIAAADAADAVERAEVFGIRVRGVEIDGDAVFARVRTERDRFVRGVVDDVERLPEARRLEGRARFVGPTTIAVGDDLELRARTIVIATGSSPVVPPVLDAVRDRVLTSDNVFELRRVPATLAVVGTGLVGLELGQALRRLGADVTFLDKAPTIGPLTDPELQRYVQAELGRRLEFELGATIEAAEPAGNGIRLRWRDREGASRTGEFEHVLAAAGRRPNVGSLGLERAGLELDERGVPKWDPQTMQCGDAPVFLAGDVDGHLPLLHEAIDEGRIAGENAARYPDVARHVRRTPLIIVFTDPQMAIAGTSYAALDPARFEIADFSFERQGRARVLARNVGFARLYATRNDCILRGAELFGPDVEHLAHLLAWSVQQKLTVPRLLRMPFYHPVLEEGLRAGLRRLARRLRVARAGPCEDLAVAAGM